MRDSLADSYYAATANRQRQPRPLAGDVSCDVAIIGGGFTGVAAALACAEKGFSVVLLEAETIGFGASGRNGGQIVNSFSRDLDVIERRHGAAQAQAMGRALAEQQVDPAGVILSAPMQGFTASLLPDGPRPAVVFTTRIAADGAVRLDGVTRAVIRSRAKYHLLTTESSSSMNFRNLNAPFSK